MSTVTRHLDASTVKAAASGRWVEILAAVGGVDRAILDGRHHPCPKCGGVDRFRMIDAAAGAVYCNQCFSSGNGDGLAAVGWLCGCGFAESVEKIGDHLGLNGSASGKGNGNGNGNPAGPRKHVAHYSYVDEDGVLLYQVVRTEPKGFYQRRPAGGGGWINTVKDVPKVLYRLPDLLAADPAMTVVVVEGEKDSDRLASLGLLATTSVMGAGKWRPEYSETLRGRPVVVLPDNDGEGRSHAEKVARSLHGVARSVQVVELPGLPEKGDVSDWLDAGGTVEELGRLVEETPQWETPQWEPREQERGQSDVDQQDDGTATDAKPERFPAVTCAELAAGTYNTEYYIDGVCVAQQPHLLGGPSKSLKTSIAWDWAISVVTGCPFLGHEDFAVARQGRVAFFSGEGGLGFLQDVGRRVCAAKQLRLEDIGDRMVVCDRIPRLDRHVDLDALGEFLAKYKTDLAFFDPCYLALGGADAGNVLAMGERLGAVNEICIKTQTTPVFLHHLKRGRVDPYAPADLGDLAWSGFAEFAGSWLLLSRREPYLATGHALHKLWLVCGGRTGHGSLHGLDVAEGVSGSEEGRYWAPRVFTPDQVDAQRQQAADGAKATRRQEQIEADRREIVEVMAKTNEPETKNVLRDRVGCGHRRFDVAFASLVGDGAIVSTRIEKANRQFYDAWRLNDEAV